MMQTPRHFDQELSDYLDGELSPPEHELVEAHLEQCDACAALLADLRVVAARAQTLDARAPEIDLWPGIAARIGLPPLRAVRVTSIRSVARRFSFSLPQLAAAGLAVALLSGGGVWWTLRSTAVAHRAAAPFAAPATTAEAMPADFQIRQYDQAVAELQRTLDANRQRLDPETVRTVEANLAVIDSAIDQARRALMADPANPYLSGHLAEQMKRKIRVLQRTTDAVTAEFGGAS